MRKVIFRVGISFIAIAFTIIFSIVVVPPFLNNPNIVEALKAGFVNPYASGYSADVVCCWLVLIVWVIYEYPKVKYGWVCLVIGFVPGVAVGFAAYLVLRSNQLVEINERENPLKHIS